MRFPKFLRKKAVVTALVTVCLAGLGLPPMLTPVVTNAACETVECEG